MENEKIQEGEHMAILKTKDNARQTAGDFSILSAGKHSRQDAGINSWLFAGRNSMQHASENSRAFSGINSDVSLGRNCYCETGDNSLVRIKGNSAIKTGDNARIQIMMRTEGRVIVKPGAGCVISIEDENAKLLRIFSRTEKNVAYLISFPSDGGLPTVRNYYRDIETVYTNENLTFRNFQYGIECEVNAVYRFGTNKTVNDDLEQTLKRFKENHFRDYSLIARTSCKEYRALDDEDMKIQIFRLFKTCYMHPFMIFILNEQGIPCDRGKLRKWLRNSPANLVKPKRL